MTKNLKPGKDMLPKPTNIQLSKGLAISIVQSWIKGHPDAVVPDRVGDYHLIQNVNKENALNVYAIGLYQCKGEKVFIKTWSGNLKNFAYYSLVNEYIASRILYEKLESYNFIKRGGVKTPRPIQYISSKYSLSLVFEYIEGKTLTSYPQSKKVEILSKVIGTLSEVSDTPTDQEKDQLSSRGKSFYILSLPVFALLTTVSDPKNYRVVSRAFVNCLRTSKSLKKTNLCIVHRDIFDNILINRHGIFIVDWGSMVLTFPDYDITHLSLRPDQELIADLVSQKLNLELNPFLKNYILIHEASSYAHPKRHENYFLEKLYELYSIKKWKN